MAHHISAHVVQAAEFVQRHHGHIALDDPAMEMAADTLRRAGVWSVADIDLPPPAEPPTVTMEEHCTDRRRIVYRLLVDGQQLGTACFWTSKAMWPWGLTIAHARVVNYGFKSREDLMAAVERFVCTGRIA